jgi:phosphoadenosine phosphosulfate reductase
MNITDNPTENQARFAEIINAIQALSNVDALKYLASTFPHKVVFSTSFGIEDQAITHLIFESGADIHFFTLDTGRLFTETYSVWDATIQKYNIAIKTYYPDTAAIEAFVSKNGINAFYDSVENRKQCCAIRKVEPLKRALAGYEVWITGIRAEQSDNRHDMPQIEWDEANKIIKFHPLLNWTWEQLNEYITNNNIPINKLHDKGFVSIGCAPCTRAIKEGENFRDGRWWWEDKSKKECGLHIASK